MASRTGVFIIIRALLGTSFGALVPVVARLTTGFVPETGAILVGAGKRAGTAGEGAEVGTGLAVAVLGG